MRAPIAIAIGLFVASTAAADPPPPRFSYYGIGTIAAHFYYHDTGELDPRDFVGDLTLGNVREGRGEARAPTSATLVLVGIDGPSFAKLTGGKVELVAREGSTVIAKQQLPLAAFSNATAKTVIVPFMIQQSGCTRVDLTLTLTAPPEAKLLKGKSTRLEELHFECPAW
jgi:hypothetical protein